MKHTAFLFLALTGILGIIATYPLNHPDPPVSGFNSVATPAASVYT